MASTNTHLVQGVLLLGGLYAAVRNVVGGLGSCVCNGVIVTRNNHAATAEALCRDLLAGDAPAV